MHVGIEELSQKWADNEIERDELVTLLAQHPADKLKGADFAPDIIDDAIQAQKDLDSGDTMSML